MDNLDLQRAVSAILFAAGECVGTQRIADAVGVPADDVREAAAALMDRLNFDRAGVRIVHLDDSWQMCSSGEFADQVARALETRKPPRLSAAQLETLTVIAYYQPATRAYVEQLRGVDSSYSVNALLQKKLIEEAGRLNVPGRPILYRTTPAFLRTFGLNSLEDLPPIEKLTEADGDEQLQLQPPPPEEAGAVTALAVCGAVAAALALLLLLPVGVRVRYDGTLRLQAAVGPAALTLYPPKPPNYRRLARRQARRRRRPGRAQKRPPDKPAPKLTAAQLRALAGLGLELAGSLPRKLLVRELTLHVACGGDDAAAAAVAYGRAWAAIGAALPPLENAFRIARRDVAAELDYTLTGLRWTVALDVRMRVGTGLLLALRAAARLIPILMQNKKKAVQGT